MKKTTTLLLLTILLLSCKSDNLEKVLKTSKNPELDMVFYTVVKAEFKEIGNSIGIVDKATKKNNYGISESDIKAQFGSKPLYWNKDIFPKAKFISNDSLVFYRSKRKKFWSFVKKNETGWIKISVPIFSENKKRVIIEVSFINPTTGFGTSNLYTMELKNAKYVIIEKQMTSIN